MIAGRDFAVADDEHHPHLAIVSRSFAERLFVHGDDAIGKYIRFGFMPEFQDLEIVGIAEDARLLDLRDAAPPLVYLSSLQYPAPWGDLYVRTERKPEALAKSVGQQIESLFWLLA